MPAVRIYTTSGWQDMAIVGAQGVQGPPVSPYQIGQTWGIAGLLSVGMVIPQIFIPKRANQTINIVGARAIINSGTNATVQFQRNGGSLGAATIVTTSAGLISLPTTALADGDRLGLSITIITGSPADLSYTVFLEHSAT